jgi:DNA-binding Xre family transcriptional regulator
MVATRGGGTNAAVLGSGLPASAQAAAIKRVVAFQIQEIMKSKHISKSEMTARMQIKSRTQLDRLLDPKNVSVTLLTLEKAANALGKKLEIQFI